MLTRPRRPQEAALAICLLLAVLFACAGNRSHTASPLALRTDDAPMNRIALSYVHLVLAVGQHDPDYVDAYYGPPEWKAEVEAAGKRPLSELRALATGLSAELAAIAPPGPPTGSAGSDDLPRLRHAYLTTQLRSLTARIDLLSGTHMSFDLESRALYDAVAPTYGAAHFRTILDQLAQLLPGDGPLIDRVEAFRNHFVIPRDRLDGVFSAAIAEARKRTGRHLVLPPGESFEVQYVTGKSWAGYNWYKGNYHSLIQVNTDLPIYIDRAVDLACHEGYPGHHLYNALLEERLVRGRGWTEFTVYPLSSPQSLIAEGTANFGIDVAFPGAERVAFERRVLFPLAGLDAREADRYYQAQELLRGLAYAGNEAARGYLDGTMTREQAADWLIHYALRSPERSEQSLRFIEKYRSYVINYNYGKDLVGAYIESRGGTTSRPDVRWREFIRLISSPRLPSGLS
ncbi:MAG: hypothetical protein M3O15_05335 [Acidobacteriota bacterium]|nr:hypothetical protein [Acidobacteriota bacterium]